jgi:hypothetical protein
LEIEFCRLTADLWRFEMEDLPVTKSALALRQQICPECEWRSGADNPAATAAAPECEKQCTMFVHLPSLARLMVMFGSEPPSGYESIVDNYLRFAHERSAVPTNEVEAPLRAYASDVLSIIEGAAVESAKDTHED